ncbi:hypothetical protein Trydic_g11098 [Trypoxylus dichotomus]
MILLDLIMMPSLFVEIKPLYKGKHGSSQAGVELKYASENSIKKECSKLDDTRTACVIRSKHLIKFMYIGAFTELIPNEVFSGKREIFLKTSP